MNDMINTTGNGPLTMSSREMAELCEKRHDSVKRTIDTLSDSGVIIRPQIVDEQTIDAMGRTRTEKVYLVGKRDSYVVVAQLSPEFTARLVDRWQELEANKPAVDPMQMLNDPAAMRGILLTYTEKVIELQAQIEADKPKTEFYDAYLNADGLYGLQNAARALGCRPNLFTRWLKENYLFYQGGNLVARIQYIQMGIFEVKTNIVDDKVRPQAYVTAKGLKYLEARVPANIKIQAA